MESKTFSCSSCGKTFKWRPELAGKKAKCPCGNMIEVPKQIEEPKAPEPENDLLAFADEIESAGRATARPVTPIPTAAAAVERPAPAPAARTSMPLPPRAKKVEYQEGNPMMKIALPVGGILLLVAAIFGLRMLQSGGSAKANKVYKADDEVCEKMINEDGQEMVEWLHGGPNRMVLGMTTEKAEGWAKYRYADGAKKIYAFGGVVSMYLVIELPDDPAKRKTLIDWQNRWAREHFAKKYRDEGQQYMLFKLSP